MPIAAEALRSRVADKVFKVALASGVTWRVEYKGSGHFFLNTSNGFNSSGTCVGGVGPALAALDLDHQHGAVRQQGHEDGVEAATGLLQKE